MDQATRESLDEAVNRYLNVVYSAAKRQVRDKHMAEDVTQAVFLVLTAKGAKIARSEGLGGWLLKVTHHAAVDAMREQRKRARVAAAAECRAGHAAGREEATTNEWEEIGPALDEALARLTDTDRQAIFLRFFEDREFRDIGDALGVREDAARKRVDRAVGKLRKLLRAKGVSVGSVALGTCLSANAVEAAPAGLGGMVLSTAMGGMESAGVVGGIAKGAIKMMAWAKAKLIVGVMAALVLTSTVGLGVQAIRVGLAQDGTAAAPAPASFKGELKNGVSFEVIGIGESAEKTESWTRPDGSAMDAPYHHLDNPGNMRMIGIALMQYSSAAQYPRISRQIAYRLNSKLANQQDAHVFLNAPMPNANIANVGSGGLDEAGKLIADLCLARLDAPAQATTSIRCEVAAGAWTDVATIQLGPPDIMSNGAFPNAQGGVPFTYTTGPAGKGSVAMNITFQPPEKFEKVRIDHRLLATLPDGRVVEAVASYPATAAGPLRLALHTFGAANLPNGGLGLNCKFQIRPFDEWIEFRNVAVTPGGATKFQVLTSDDPQPATSRNTFRVFDWGGAAVVETTGPNRTFDFELNDGRLEGLSRDGKRDEARMDEHGIDVSFDGGQAGAAATEFVRRHTAIIPVDLEAWTRLSADEIFNRMRDENPSSGVTHADLQKLPLVYLVKTRDGTAGLLRLRTIVEPDRKNQKGYWVEHKMVVPADSPKARPGERIAPANEPATKPTDARSEI